MYNIQDRFNNFMTNYPTAEVRFETAQLLADDKSPLNLREDRISHYFLAANWGDSQSDLQALTTKVYDFSDNLGLQLGQPLIILKKGSLEDVQREDIDFITNDLDFTLGLLESYRPTFGFRGELSNKEKTRMGISAPYLGFGMMVNLSNAIHFRADILRELEHHAYDKSESKSLAKIIGCVSLKDPNDLDNYRATKGLIDYPHLIGISACRSFLKQLSEKVNPDGQEYLKQILDIK